MMSFIHSFARKCEICHRIDPNPTEGAHDNFKFITSEFTKKYAISRSQNKKIAPPPVGTARNPTPSALCPPTLNSCWRHCIVGARTSGVLCCCHWLKKLIVYLHECRYIGYLFSESFIHITLVIVAERLPKIGASELGLRQQTLSIQNCSKKPVINSAQRRVHSDD